MSALAVDGPTIYAGGSFSIVGGASRARIAAIDAATGAATAWNPGSNASILALAMHESMFLAGTTAATIGGELRVLLAALDPVTGEATDWNPNMGALSFVAGSLYALAVIGPRVYVGGAFSDFGTLPQAGFAVIDNATVDVPPRVGPPGSLPLRIVPNPARGIARIEFTQPREAQVRVDVFEVQGHEVARLADGVRPAGRHEVIWNGRVGGRRAAAGLYWVRYQSLARTATARLSLLD